MQFHSQNLILFGNPNTDEESPHLLIDHDRAATISARGFSDESTWRGSDVEGRLTKEMNAIVAVFSASKRLTASSFELLQGAEQSGVNDRILTLTNVFRNS